MHDKYQAAGGQAKLVAFGLFGSDAHAVFTAASGATIWEPELDAFLLRIGLPHAAAANPFKFAPARGAADSPASQRKGD